MLRILVSVVPNSTIFGPEAGQAGDGGKKRVKQHQFVLNNPGQFGLFILALFLQFDTM